jgi:hypothetical protein
VRRPPSQPRIPRTDRCLYRVSEPRAVERGALLFHGQPERVSLGDTMFHLQKGWRGELRRVSGGHACVIRISTSS